MVIWDLTTRFTHWVIAIAALLNLFVLEEGDDPHQWMGYAALAALAIRFFWGFRARNPASRFSSFPLHPRESWRHFRTIFSGEKIDYPGHNPLASWVYVAIWLCVIGLVVTGYMMEEIDAFWGDETLNEIHAWIAWSVQWLVVIHLLGMTFDAIKFRRLTWLGMFTGKR